MHLLVVHVETEATHVPKHICIHHRALGSILDEDLDGRLIDVGLLCCTIEGKGNDDAYTDDVEVPDFTETSGLEDGMPTGDEDEE